MCTRRAANSNAVLVTFRPPMVSVPPPSNHRGTKICMTSPPSVMFTWRLWGVGVGVEALEAVVGVEEVVEEVVEVVEAVVALLHAAVLMVVDVLVVLVVDMVLVVAE